MATTLISPLNAKVAFKRETTFGTEAAGDYRGIPLISFEPQKAGSTNTSFKKIRGIQGDIGASQGGTHYELSFSFCAGGADADQGSLIDVLNMIYGADEVTGADPFTHTFNVQNSNVKPSWTIYYETGDAGERSIYTGFTAMSVEIEINKTGNGLSIVTVTGMAQAKSSSGVKTVDFTDGYVYWSTNTATVLESGSAVDEFETATILIESLGNPKQVISGSEGPIAMANPTLDASITFEGPWNSGTPTSQSILQTSFQNGTVVQTDMAVRIGPVTVSDSYTITFPTWACTDFTDPPLDAEGEDIRFSATIKNVHRGATAEQHISVLNSSINIDWDTL